MSEIDLSKAKIGDKFRTRCGCILVYVGEHLYDIADKYLLKDEIGSTFNFFKYGYYMVQKEHRLDLVEQVFDEPLSAMEKIERSERINRDMQKIAEIADEEKQELQRRQEVVELAEKMYTMLEIENFKYYLCNSGNYTFESEGLMRLTFVRAGTFINKKHQYLKEGKL